MEVLNVSHHMCHLPEGMHNTPPMTVREAYIASIHVGGFGLIYLRYAGLAASDATRCRHKVISVWTGADGCIWRPLAVLSVCWSRVKMPADPAMEGTVLRRVPISLCQCRHGHQIALGGMVLSRAISFPLWSCGRVRT